MDLTFALTPEYSRPVTGAGAMLEAYQQPLAQAKPRGELGLKDLLGAATSRPVHTSGVSRVIELLVEQSIGPPRQLDLCRRIQVSISGHINRNMPRSGIYNGDVLQSRDSVCALDEANKK